MIADQTTFAVVILNAPQVQDREKFCPKALVQRASLLMRVFGDVAKFFMEIHKKLAR